MDMLSVLAVMVALALMESLVVTILLVEAELLEAQLYYSKEQLLGLIHQEFVVVVVVVAVDLVLPALLMVQFTTQLAALAVAVGEATMVEVVALWV